MPRGRHRHSPPLHRLLPPSAIAGVSLVCALGPWVFTEAVVLRGLAAAAAATAIIGAFVMRRWDIQAGKQVADLTRARVSDEWRFEERVAELESDLEESRELRKKLEQRLRAKRSELAGLRNEHAALLRRYATAETERASALEGRRLLEIETTVPAARELTAGPGKSAAAQSESERADSTDAAQDEPVEADTTAAEAADDVDGTAEAPETPETPEAPGAFSPAGSQLFLRAGAALSRLDAESDDSDENAENAENADNGTSGEPADKAGEVGNGGDSASAPVQEDDPQGKPEAADEHARAAATDTPDAPDVTDTDDATADVDVDAPGGAVADGGNGEDGGDDDPSAQPVARETDDEPAAARPAGTPAPSAAVVPRPAAPAQRPAGHFTVPTAVAVVPASQPVRRPGSEGGFDFFGTHKSSASAAMEAVQNEDLADVVGQEALALHKAEAEAEFKPADEDTRGVGQVIDLTAHDETEQIDLQGLRSAAS
ncbi:MULTISPECIES: hypothetical protein [Streptomyces]|uniref:Secreted protein n=1 Tax=Streptomyces lasalocidi TaxID=324833 RepID=A0A4U5WLH4_STRLS|nr:hypothetical protein [Streptomyces lasalocidi]TKT02041.1 hypothetical protein E4U91_19395 [Streptomyces lasalocidi]